MPGQPGRGIVANRFLYLIRHGDAGDDGQLTDVGSQQAEAVGQRLRSVPLAAIHHSPLPRAVQTAQTIARYLPGVPTYVSDTLGDYLPSLPDPDTLPPSLYAGLVGGYSQDELGRGPALAAAALERHAVAADEDVREVVVTHNFLIGWFVRHALDAPAGRWLGLNQANCALTVILYRTNRPPSLVTFNDLEHLPAALRWTGFPPEPTI